VKFTKDEQEWLYSFLTDYSNDCRNKAKYWEGIQQDGNLTTASELCYVLATIDEFIMVNRVLLRLSKWEPNVRTRVNVASQAKRNIKVGQSLKKAIAGILERETEKIANLN